MNQHQQTRAEVGLTAQHTQDLIRQLRDEQVKITARLDQIAADLTRALDRITRP